MTRHKKSGLAGPANFLTRSLGRLKRMAFLKQTASLLKNPSTKLPPLAQVKAALAQHPLSPLRPLRPLRGLRLPRGLSGGSASQQDPQDPQAEAQEPQMQDQADQSPDAGVPEEE